MRLLILFNPRGDKKVYRLRVVLITLVVTFVGAVAANHKTPTSIKDRTAPTGSVYQVGDDVPVAEAPVEVSAGVRDGEQVYSTKCAMCHAAGVAGAPKSGSSEAWADRIAQGESVLFEHAINGYQGKQGFMPAKGGCADCSDDEVIAAVQHMLELIK